MKALNNAPNPCRYSMMSNTLLTAACGDYGAVTSATAKYIEAVQFTRSRENVEVKQACARWVQERDFAQGYVVESPVHTVPQPNDKLAPGEHVIMLTAEAARFLRDLEEHPLNPPREIKPVQLGTNPRFA